MDAVVMRVRAALDQYLSLQTLEPHPELLKTAAPRASSDQAFLTFSNYSAPNLLLRKVRVRTSKAVRSPHQLAHSR